MLRGQRHDCTNRAFDRDSVVAVDSEKAGLGADGREIDKGTIVDDDGLEVVHPLKKHPVELARQDCGISGYNALALVQRDLEEHVSSALHIEIFSCDIDRVLLGKQVGIVGWCQDTREGGGEIDVRCRFFLDRLYNAAFSSANDVVKLVVQLTSFRMQTVL